MDHHGKFGERVRRHARNPFQRLHNALDQLHLRVTANIADTKLGLDHLVRLTAGNGAQPRVASVTAASRAHLPFQQSEAALGPICAAEQRYPRRHGTAPPHVSRRDSAPFHRRQWRSTVHDCNPYLLLMAMAVGRLGCISMPLVPMVIVRMSTMLMRMSTAALAALVIRVTMVMGIFAMLMPMMMLMLMLVTLLMVVMLVRVAFATAHLPAFIVSMTLLVLMTVAVLFAAVAFVSVLMTVAMLFAAAAFVSVLMTVAMLVAAVALVLVCMTVAMLFAAVTSMLAFMLVSIVMATLHLLFKLCNCAATAFCRRKPVEFQELQTTPSWGQYLKFSWFFEPISHGVYTSGLGATEQQDSDSGKSMRKLAARSSQLMPSHAKVDRTRHQ